jgi:transposase
MAFSTNSRMAVIGKTCPAYLPPYSTVYWHYKQWRAAGVIEQLMSVLHEQVREQVKKNRSGQH